MDETASREITRLLHRWKGGDEDALARLWELVYGRLSRLAASYLRAERPGHTLDTGSLVHEAFMRLVDQDQVSWRDRSHFFALSAKMMRRILVDHARRVDSSKRGGELQTIGLHEVYDLDLSEDPDLVRLDDALNDLEAEEPDLANLVVMRYFGGLTRDEIAEVQGVSTMTVARQWRTARAWLFAYLSEGQSDVG